MKRITDSAEPHIHFIMYVWYRNMSPKYEEIGYFDFLFCY